MEEQQTHEKEIIAKNKESEVESNKAYQFADLIIVFIGVSMILLPLFTVSKDIPREFLFGATLSSFLLALSDGLIITERMGIKRFYFYGVSFVLGILSIIYVPVLLSIHPDILPRLEPFSDALTIMALGFVLMIIGYRSFDYKQKIQKNLQQNLNMLIKEIDRREVHLDEIKNATKTMRTQIVEHEKTVNEHSVSVKNTITRLENENIQLKKKLRKYENNKE